MRIIVWVAAKSLRTPVGTPGLWMGSGQVLAGSSLVFVSHAFTTPCETNTRLAYMRIIVYAYTYKHMMMTMAMMMMKIMMMVRMMVRMMMMVLYTI